MNTSDRLAALCGPHPDRHVGGPGNRAANELFATEAAAAGFEIERLPFEPLEWLPGDGGAWLETPSGERVSLHVGPFSEGFKGDGALVSACSLEELEGLDATGRILLLHGQITAEQLTPRNYPFYRMDEHAAILSAIDAAAPAAVIAATDRTPMAAALCPFPLFEDGDFGHPSAYLHADEAPRLLPHVGERVQLRIDSAVRRVAAEQIVARKPGAQARRVVVSAHIDSRYGTPGALDNGTGVAVLLSVADRLADVSPGPTVELVPFNGEDDYAAPGEVAYLASPAADPTGIALAVNIDAVARRGDTTCISFYGCPDAIREAALEVAATVPDVAEGPEWPMSDHMVFAMRGVPALAITSSGLFDIAATVAHTERDTPDLADAALVEGAAEFIARLIVKLGESPDGRSDQ